MFGSNYFNKNSILRIEKGPFYFKFCILFNFQDPRFSFDLTACFLLASVKVLDYSNSADLLCQGLFLTFGDFFSFYLKVISISFIFCLMIPDEQKIFFLQYVQDSY